MTLAKGAADNRARSPATMGAASEERSSLMSRPDEAEAAEPARRVAALALAVGLSVAAVAGAGGVRRLIAGDAFAETPLRFRVANPEYGDAAPASLALYPFAHVGEPHRASRLTAEDAVGGATYAWTVRLDGALLASGAGATFAFNFTAPGRRYAVALAESPSGRTAEDDVHCKYVRREIRALTDRERSAYFDAFEVVAKLPLEEGRARYGEHFVNLHSTTIKHVHGTGCSPFHGGLSFLTAHTAFTYEVDRAMQLVDPGVLTPYWDFTLDAEFLGANWTESQLFQLDWFGPLMPKNAQRTLEGRFANVSVPSDCDFDVHNAYCRVTDERNEDPSALVTRAHELCGLKTDVALPGCSEFSQCLTTTSLTDLHTCAEDVMHGNMHTVIGGFFGCPYALGDLVANHPSWEEMLTGIGTRAINIWQHVYGAKAMKCPLKCDAAEDSWETCHCSCPALSPKPGPNGTVEAATLGVDASKRFFNETGIIYFADPSDCASFASPYVYKKYFDVQTKADGSCDYSVKGLNNDDNKEFLHFLAFFSCSPGKFGAMSTAASANDPLFWPIHPLFDRLLAYMRLSGDLDLAWPDATCRGHSLDDTLPFSGFRDADNATDLYTNRDLLDVFDPASAELNYVFADFSWDHCDAAIADAATFAFQDSSARTGGGGHARR